MMTVLFQQTQKRWGGLINKAPGFFFNMDLLFQTENQYLTLKDCVGLFLVAEELQTDRHEDAAQTDGLKGHWCP